MFLFLIGHEAKFQHPLDVKSYSNIKQSDNEYLLVADTYNNCIKKIDVKRKQVDKFVLTRDTSPLNEPNSICFDQNSEQLFIADTNNHLIRVVKNFNINEREIKLDELEIRFSGTSQIDGLKDLQVNDRVECDVCVSFPFKLNSNAENTWKATFLSKHTPHYFEGVFKQPDQVDSKNGSYLYRLNGFCFDKSEEIDSIEFCFNLIYCEKGGEEKSCKMYKKKKTISKKEINKILSKFMQRSIVFEIND